MKLSAEQGVVYAWINPSSNDNLCKIGKSTVGKFYHSVIQQSKRYIPMGIEVLGIQVFDTEADALIREKELHTQFNRINGTEFVYLSEEVLLWIENECIEYNEDFFIKFARKSDTFRSRRRRTDPEYRAKERKEHTQQEKERRENELGYRERINANAARYRKKKRLEANKNQPTLFD